MSIDFNVIKPLLTLEERAIWGFVAHYLGHDVVLDMLITVASQFASSEMANGEQINTMIPIVASDLKLVINKLPVPPIVRWMAADFVQPLAEKIVLAADKEYHRLFAGVVSAKEETTN